MLPRRSHANLSTKPSFDASETLKSAWEYYIDITATEDSEREREWQELLDVVLVFAAIFASFLSTFLVETLDLLQQDPLDAIQDILLYQTRIMQNQTALPYVPPVFSPPAYAIIVNAFFFASLGVVLLTAVLCMLVKGWIRGLDRKLWAVRDLQKRAVIKELRELRMRRWNLPGLIAVLPILIYTSLVLFFIGLVVYLFHIHILPALLALGIFAIGVLVYVVPVFIAVIDEFSPFKSFHSRWFGDIYRRWYCSLAGVLEDSHSTMALPRTPTEHMCEKVIVQIQKHVPLSEKAILDLPPSWAKTTLQEITSRTSVSLLNRLFTYTAGWELSIHPRNISTCILLHLDDLDIRCPSIWPFLEQYNTGGLSIKEVHCLAYGICMQHHSIYNANWKPIMKILEHSPDPWFHLVASLLRVRCISGGLGILEREADILHAISNTDQLATDQWRFALSSVYALFPHAPTVISPEETRAFICILAKLLQQRVYYTGSSTVEETGAIDFWLYVMSSILGNPTPEFSSQHNFSHANDIEAPAKGMTRDPSGIRRLFLLSRERGLDPSLMRGCLISILFVLVRLNPRKQQQRRLVDQYLEIVKEEMDVPTWSDSLSEFFTDPHRCPLELANTVMCFLMGTYTNNNLTDWEYSERIIQEYDRNLRISEAQPTTSFLRVMNEVIKEPSSITGLELQNAWLSLYANNRTRSPHNAPIPEMWSSDCPLIASERLQLYDNHQVTPEIDLVIFFLSSPSAAIACRALRWYVRLEENALMSSDAHHSLAFPTIFRKGLSVDENRESWLLLVTTLLPSLPIEGKSHFAETFFGYGENNQAGAGQRTTAAEVGDDVSDSLDMENPATSTQADGFGWMEDVWTTVLRRYIVHIDRVDNPWPEPSRFVHATYPESIYTTQLAPLQPSMAQNEGPEGAVTGNGVDIGPETMAGIARGTLNVLAQLLEAGADLMPKTLLDRVKNSSLLSDERLRRDTGSLSRIQVVLDRNQER